MNLFEQHHRLNQLFVQSPVKAAYVAGSLANRTTFGHLNDVDIAILLMEQIKSDQFLDYQFYFLSELAKRLDSDAIDVVILNKASLMLKLQVIKHGQILYSRDEKQRVQFEARAVMDYLDYKKFDEVQNQALSRRLAPQPPTLDRTLLQPQLGQLQDTIEILEKLASIPYEEFSQDYRSTGAAERALQLAIERCVSICGQLIAAQGLPRPESYHAHLSTVARHKIISRDLSYRLEIFTNIREDLVWGTEPLDHHLLYDYLHKYTADLKSFIKEINALSFN